MHSPEAATKGREAEILFLPDVESAAALMGALDENVTCLSRVSGVQIVCCGDRIHLCGTQQARHLVRSAVNRLLDIYATGAAITPDVIVETIGMLRYEAKRKPYKTVQAQSGPQGLQQPCQDHEHRSTTDGIVVTKGRIFARTQMQARFIEALRTYPLCFCSGPAGTGKTFLAVAHAVSVLLRGERKKIVLTRPAIEAGEHLGFLPGSAGEKMAPYLEPLRDALRRTAGVKKLHEWEAAGRIEIAPLAFMRGRTITNSVAILDEGQNTTPAQMKMFLTRLGERTQMIITGDSSQSDISPRGKTGLAHAIASLQTIDEISITCFGLKDVCRSPLVERIIAAYEEGA